jgi:hypothetical protein
MLSAFASADNIDHGLNNSYYYIHKVWIWGILQSDWFSTSRILAHILLVEENKMAAQTEFPTFANEKTASCSLFIAFTGLKTQWKNSHKLFTG